MKITVKKKFCNRLKKTGRKKNPFSFWSLAHRNMAKKASCEVIEACNCQKPANPAGYVLIRALRDRWILCSKGFNTDYAYQEKWDKRTLQETICWLLNTKEMIFRKA